MRGKELERFREWLRERGAEVLEPTNDFEVVRFRTVRGVSVIYRNKRNEITAKTGDAADASSAFRLNKSWHAGNRVSRKRVTPVMRAVVARDGPECFFCGQVPEVPTMEHLVPLTSGGPNHISNFAIACEGCNVEAGNLSVVEKVRLREEKRSALK